jgi:tetratricopeptide (TPR) repeat protein/S1-C subfamily serine protease
MYRSSLFLTAALVGTTVALIQPVAVAKSASEVETIARSATVEIKLKNNPEAVGSGVIINRQGDLYTLVTNRHVICGSSDCDQISESETYTLGLADRQQYKISKKAIKLLGNKLDLAIIQFRSNRNYTVAKVSAPGSLSTGDLVYAAGFPKNMTFRFGTGQAIAVVNKRFNGDKGGYTVIYNAQTLPGMSGGGVFNSNGQLVAIHGYGDRFTQNTDNADRSRVGSKIGYNRGIPVSALVQGMAEVGINLGGGASVRSVPPQNPVTADEYFIAGFNKFVDPGSNVAAGKRQAIQEFSKSIQLDPQYIIAYLMRAISYEQVNELQKSLSDYDRAITIDPKYSITYYNRGNLKYKLNDARGAIADYTKAIAIDPVLAMAYYNRAAIKEEKLNDIPGALADYTKAIAIDPKDFAAYYSRANLKYEKLNDSQGALADLNQAIAINPQSESAYHNRGIIKEKKLNDLQGALTDYNQAIEINPKFTEAYYSRGVIKQTKLNDDPGAMADYNRTILLNPKYFEAYSNRGALKYKLKDVQGALADYNQAIAINSKAIGVAQAYYNRAKLRSDKLNDFQGALADYNQAILIDAKFAYAYLGRAQVKLYQKDKQGAIPDLRQAAKLLREQGDTQRLQAVISVLQQLGSSE